MELMIVVDQSCIGCRMVDAVVEGKESEVVVVVDRRIDCVVVVGCCSCFEAGSKAGLVVVGCSYAEEDLPRRSNLDLTSFLVCFLCTLASG
jgi:hypothetical protein